MKININDQILDVADNTRIIDLIKGDKYQYQAARVNNRIRELNYKIPGDSNVELLTLKERESTTIYQSTLRYLIIMAIKRIYPFARVIFNYSVSRAIFATIPNFNGPFRQSDLDNIQAELDKIIAEDIPIVRSSVSKEEAEQYYNDNGFRNKAKILKYRTEDTVHMYECDGYKNYMFGYMLPSTGFIKAYKLQLYAPGFMIQYPRSELGGVIPEFCDERVLRDALRDANKWGNITKASYIYQMNRVIEQGTALEFINLCETRHNNQFVKLGEAIASEINRIRLIAIAGPSSSGKTTFTNRLKIQLRSFGIDPLMISIDDFYRVDKENTPKDELGRPDFEHIDALDRELFDKIMYKLIAGEAVSLPHYSFKDKSRSFGEPVKLNPGQPIMIEGIHALNDMLTPSIDNELKFKVYIAPQVQLHIDDHNPIPITDVRLLRRMVRDNATRHTPCEKTLEMWSSVRNGEFKWIYPHQASADFVFNSVLSYEFCVMKKHALPLLEAVPDDSPYFIQANRLIKFLKYFKDISDNWIPCNSILREFIGGSIFYTDDLI